MPLKNLLSLHEAIVVALINRPNRTASFEEIANFIDDRSLYLNRKGKISLATQVMLRSTKAKGAYHHLFEEIGAGYIRLRDTYVNFPIQMSEAFDAVLDHNYELFHPPAKSLNVVDVQLKTQRKIKISPDNVVCIIAIDLKHKKTGNKKFIYLREIDLQGVETIGIYTIHGSLENLQNQIDPLSNYLSIISDNIFS